MSDRPSSPKAFSMRSNLARHSTIQTAAAVNGTQKHSQTLVASSNESATPPISAMNVSKVTAIDPNRFASPTRGPSR